MADRHEFKFVVNIHRPSYYFAGTIISPEWVVTSAQFAWDDLSTYTIVAGDHKIDTVDGEEQFRNVTKILIHPNYTRYVTDDVFREIRTHSDLHNLHNLRQSILQIILSKF